MSNELILLRQRRKRRIRKHVSGTTERPRLTVFRSSKHIYAQVVDDTGPCSRALTAVSTLTKDVASGLGEKTKLEQAKVVGAAVAKACLAKGVTKVVFDRNGYLYHGRIRALADGAREAGLDF
jgi:large subunit ribosomal protein L18